MRHCRSQSNVSSQVALLSLALAPRFNFQKYFKKTNAVCVEGIVYRRQLRNGTFVFWRSVKKKHVPIDFGGKRKIAAKQLRWWASYLK